MIISGGGTGGHVYPAIAIANAFKERHPDAEILFVGAEGKMEMTRVPQAGYKIVGLWISGLQRRLTIANLAFPFKLISSYFKARMILNQFKPDVIVGTGGYASGPIMLAGASKKIPSLIQEQNSYAGLTNKRLAKKAKRVCVAYPGMEKYFPKDKIIFTGNPVRKDISDLDSKKTTALSHFGLDAQKTLLIIGGSLGARTINESVLSGLNTLIDNKVQVIWQTGKMYFESVKAQISDKDLRKVRVFDFLVQMDLAYAASDVVIARAGALSISELCVSKRPAILVPSPNVAEDHQTRNAMALVQEDAAVMVKDSEARERLVAEAMKLLFDAQKCEKLSANIAKLSKPNAAAEIAGLIEEIIDEA